MCACVKTFSKACQEQEIDRRIFFETFFAKSLHVSKIISTFAVG